MTGSLADGHTERLRSIRGWLELRTPTMLTRLAELVDSESPTGDTRLLSIAAQSLATWFGEIGRAQLITTTVGRAPHVLVSLGSAHEERDSPLVLCHYDTVWPAGTVADWRFEVDGDVARGPGVLDMKASIVMVHFAYQALRAHGCEPERGARVLISADEELGNPTSEALIVDLARRARAALVLEPPLSDGSLKTSRKGYSRIRLRIDGRAAHAGIEPEKGVNAAIEAAHLALFADRLDDPTARTSVTVGVLQAGGRSNVVPASATLELDVRARSAAEMQRVVRALRSRETAVDGAAVHMDVEIFRVPMPRVADTDPLLASARRIGGALGIPIREGDTGGVSEGNLTQAAGVPTLDGLGAVGDGPHARNEHIAVSSLLDRGALLAGLLADLGSPWRGPEVV